MERSSYIDFDELRIITTAVSDIGYWLAEATNDDVVDVFDAGGDSTVHQHIP